MSLTAPVIKVDTADAWYGEGFHTGAIVETQGSPTGALRILLLVRWSDKRHMRIYAQTR